MKIFDIPKIVKPLAISEYAEDSLAVMWVWLNAPQETLREHGEIIRETLEMREKLKSLPAETEQAALDEIGKRLDALLERRLAWFANIWSQGKEPETHWTLDEVRQLKEQTAGSDPQFFGWLCSATLTMIAEHRSEQKKILRAKP